MSALLAAALAFAVLLAVPRSYASGDTLPPVLYRLPWTGGASYPVIQDYSRHFDFRLPSGTQVRAARGGTVYVKGASENGGCCDPRCSVYDNYVRITHEDGSYGFYQHLMYGGITVKTGDTVQAGDCLGLSGATGYVCGLTGEHLHFNVNTDVFNSGGDPYGVAFTQIQFVEGAIPSGGAYTPPSQNGTAPCGAGPALARIYLPLAARSPVK